MSDKLWEPLSLLTAKRLRPRAQGCRALAATLGKDGQSIQPQRGCANRTLHK